MLGELQFVRYSEGGKDGNEYPEKDWFTKIGPQVFVGHKVRAQNLYSKILKVVPRLVSYPL